MLEHVPAWLGSALQSVRAGHAGLTLVDPVLELGGATIDLSSPAFGDHAPLPARFTADGAGVSPPLAWGEVPAGTRALALIVEDPDAPAPEPLVHAIVWNMDAGARALEEGALAAPSADGGMVGRNSYLRQGWLPPDPPTGHGPHDYVFQLFALSHAPELGDAPGRGAFTRAMAGHVLAAGLLTGTYARDPAQPRPSR